MMCNCNNSLNYLMRLYLIMLLFSCCSFSYAESESVFIAETETNPEISLSLIHDTSIAQITVSENNPVWSSLNGLLLDKSGKKLMLVPALYCKDVLSIPEGIETNAEVAFAACSELKTIILPSTYTYYVPALYNGNLSNIEVSSTNTTFSSIDGILYDKDVSALISYPPARTTTYFSLPDGVQKMDEFSLCANALQILTLPESLITISPFAACDCSNLQYISWGGSCKYIGKCAFMNTAIQVLFLPEGLEYIGDFAFDGCPLTYVYLPSTVSYIGEDAFGYMADTKITFVYQEGTYAATWVQELQDN